MTMLPKKIARATAISIALLGGVAVVGSMIVAEPAYAKSDKAKSKKKKKERRENRGGGKPQWLLNQGANGQVVADVPVEDPTVEETGKEYKGKGNAIALALGVHPSELGNLNAWNNKSENENPNSMPGKLAAFEQMLIDGNMKDGANQDYMDDMAAINDAMLLDNYSEFLVTDPDGNCRGDMAGDTACSYDLASAFPGGMPADDDPLYDDYMALMAANDAYSTIDETEAAYDPNYDPTDPRTYLEEVANKEIDDELYQAITDWLAAQNAAAQGDVADEGIVDDTEGGS